MRRIPLFLLILSCATAFDAAAQGTPRPQRDSIRMAEVEEADSVDAEVSVDEEAAEADTIPEPV
ncbi:MAG TPA: hypothetical protein VFY65_02260, partial [Longimicrobium sp.]|nr:hypothetical protein [Longimicrobium sp.]